MTRDRLRPLSDAALRPPLGWTLLDHDAPRGWARLSFEARA